MESKSDVNQIDDNNSEHIFGVAQPEKKPRKGKRLEPLRKKNEKNERRAKLVTRVGSKSGYRQTNFHDYADYLKPWLEHHSSKSGIVLQYLLDLHFAFKEVFPSSYELQRITGYGKSQVRNILLYLESLKFISIHNHENSNKYDVHVEALDGKTKEIMEWHGIKIINSNESKSKTASGKAGAIADLWQKEYKDRTGEDYGKIDEVEIKHLKELLGDFDNDAKRVSEIVTYFLQNFFDIGIEKGTPTVHTLFQYRKTIINDMAGFSARHKSKKGQFNPAAKGDHGNW